jgi:hypothetical protein
MSDLMRLLSALILATAIWNIYAVGVSWPETQALKGSRRFLSLLSAFVSASGLNYCYVLAVWFCVNSFYPLALSETWLSLCAQSGLALLAASALFVPRSFWLLRWRRAFYDGAFAQHSPAVRHAWAMHHGEYRSTQTWQHAVIDLVIWLEVRTHRKVSSRLINLVLILLAVLIVPGATLTAMSILKLAATEHLPHHPDPGRLTRGWLKRF